MRTFLGFLLTGLFLTSCASVQEVPATKLEKANVLPLTINDHFQFRKAKLYFNDPEAKQPNTTSEPVTFERLRMNFGAVSSYERNHRAGNYFTFFWRTSETADVTVRLEFRQAALGDYVMAQERYYPSAHGSYKSDFEVIGDDYLENGRVTSWRVLLITEGHIVAVKQSFMWR